MARRWAVVPPCAVGGVIRSRSLPTSETGAARAVGDGLYANVLFLHAAGDRGLHALVRLKANVPTLWAAAPARFGGPPPTLTVEARGDRIELWDADDFDPWTDLRWSSARVLSYRQHHPDSLLVRGLLVALTLTLERLIRLRFLHRGAHPPAGRHGLAAAVPLGARGGGAGRWIARVRPRATRILFRPAPNRPAPCADVSLVADQRPPADALTAC